MSVAAELSLRPYQQRCVNLAHEKLRIGFRRPLVVAPTGSGKRYMLCHWARKAAEQERECLIVTDRRLLVEQAANELYSFGIDHGIIMEGYLENRIARVQLATIQSLESRYLKRDLDGMPPADLIVIDEAHKGVEQYKALLAHYPAAYVFLLTATPVGAAGKTLIQEGYADCLTEGVKNSELIRQGYLLRTRVIAPSEPNIEGIKIRNRQEYGPDDLSQRVQEVTSFANIFNEWAPFADRKTVVFAPGIAYCNGLHRGRKAGDDSFYARGIRAEVLHSNIKPSERQRIWKEFTEGDLKVLLTVDMLREGADCPAASCGIDLQPNAQFRSYWQKIGRIKRPYHDQDSAVYIDMAGNYWKFLHPDDDPDWEEITGDNTTQDWIEAKRKNGTPQPIRCPKCATVRAGGKRCPDCGFEVEPKETVRVIRMGNGKLKEIPAEQKRKRAKSEVERKLARWQSMLFVGMKTGMTLSQCAGLLKKRHDEWPAKTFPFVPPEGSAVWSQRVPHVCGDVRGLVKAFVIAKSAQRRFEEKASGEGDDF